MIPSTAHSLCSKGAVSSSAPRLKERISVLIRVSIYLIKVKSMSRMPSIRMGDKVTESLGSG
jgi:hypothetical protein